MTDKLEQPSPSDKLKRHIDYSEFVKNVAAIAAIFLGGCWGLYTFFALQQPQIAEVQASRHSSRLSMSIDTQVKDTPSGTCIFAEVTLENIGIKPVLLTHRWGSADARGLPGYMPPLAAYKVDFLASGDVSKPKGPDAYKKSIKGHPLTIPTSEVSSLAKPGEKPKSKSSLVTWDLIRVGEKRTVPFVVRVNDAGVYLVAYRVPVELSREEVAIYTKAGKENPGSAVWSARKYVVVDQVMKTDPAAATQSDVGKEGSSTEEDAMAEEEEEEE